eukprot:5484785-Pyramimonas_sp.AAC.1
MLPASQRASPQQFIHSFTGVHPMTGGRLIGRRAGGAVAAEGAGGTRWPQRHAQHHRPVRR